MIPTRATVPPPSTHAGAGAIVLSGGGARGAYEVGVLRFIYGDLAKRIGVVPRFDIVSGTSVGAINGAYLASILDDPTRGIERLNELWLGLELDQVLGFGVGQALKLPRVLLGGTAAAGLFDVRPLIRIVERNMRWRRLSRNLRTGVLQALTVSATHVATGRPWVFVDRAPDVAMPQGMPPTIKLQPDAIGPQHVLASAAIPILFPPVAVHGDLFVDGGLRLNTPMAPAIHLGARRLLVIALTSPPGEAPKPAVEPGVFPGVNFLLGKILNAFFLDRINADFLELERYNRIIDDGTAIYGPDFAAKMNERALSQGRLARHRIHTVAIHPSEDIGALATRHLRAHEARLGRLLGRGIVKLLDLGEGADSDLLTYILFDGDFARQLMDLGESDARKRESDLARYFLIAQSETAAE